MENIICAVVLFVISIIPFVISFRSFKERGFLFNNAYIYASKEDRERMNKKPYYRQTAIVFLIIGIFFALCGVALILDFVFLT
ncbi:MAG: DUF3784 domain-containing protein [Clostridia bacterium]|nr:DUF3784 domain-containing protein [Clostridia bacterium]